ncbi:MAG: hypothetical protein KF912_02660 [Phycisphaeraceae bacterium]|nr:hypothetical protein [Phycisphaeraceae bacterium]MBX3366201.1 hypothetical protein [Phycisphaeraceae bacterium]
MILEPFSARIVFAAIVCLTLSATEALAQEQLQLEAHILAEPRVSVSTSDLSQAQEVDTIDLVRGDPVSLRIVLSNTGTAASAPTGALGEILSPLHIRVKRPDGSMMNAIHEARNITYRAWREIAPVMPGEAQTLDTFLYEHVTEISPGQRESQYLFDVPGEYEVTVIYKTGDPRDHLRFEQGRIPHAPPTLTAGVLTVNVLEDAIPNWQQLQEAEILSYIGRDRWPAIEAGSQLQDAITSANRPWLTEWTNRIVQLSTGPE